jgi:FKBP-type peptidyl-prolyl cis-trans isomerase
MSGSDKGGSLGLPYKIADGNGTIASPQTDPQTQSQSEKNKIDGDIYLANNSNQPGVLALPDGLQYKILVDGTGATPTPNDTITINYRGTFIDGVEFDSSYKRGQPAQFPVGGLIHGLMETFTKMRVGSKWQVFIPSQLAYGEKGRASIPPNSVLIFEVELLSTQTPP